MDHEKVSPQLGEDTDSFVLTRYSEYVTHVAAMVNQSTRRICIFSQDFDAAILDQETIVTAFSRFIRTHGRVAQVHILVQRPETAIRQGHRLVELARRLPTFVHIHRPADQHRNFADAFITFDNSGYLSRELGDRPEGTGCYADSLRTVELVRKFDELWAMSEVEAEFRRLGI
ncbi:MAG TPA: hypothetical protein DCF45_11965 [Gammaproteobacteria bacterium]|nr:hypothetical protein [Gammaproteobacteria bacterium]